MKHGGEFWQIFSVSHGTKPEDSSKNRGKFRANFGTKIRKVRGTFVLQPVCSDFKSHDSNRKAKNRSNLRERPPGLFQHELTVLVFWSQERLVPGSQLQLGVGHTPSTAGTLRRNFRKNSGKTPETLSERFLEFPSRVRLGCPKPCNSRHLQAPERFQEFSPPPSTAGDASFSRSGSGEDLSEPVMQFPAVLRVFLREPGTLCPPPPRLAFAAHFL